MATISRAQNCVDISKSTVALNKTPLKYHWLAQRSQLDIFAGAFVPSDWHRPLVTTKAASRGGERAVGRSIDWYLFSRCATRNAAGGIDARRPFSLCRPCRILSHRIRIGGRSTIHYRPSTPFTIRLAWRFLPIHCCFYSFWWQSYHCRLKMCPSGGSTRFVTARLSRFYRRIVCSPWEFTNMALTRGLAMLLTVPSTNMKKNQQNYSL